MKNDFKIFEASKEGLINIRKEEDNSTTVCTDKWTKFQCHSCYILA
jgi:hypothetical protein